MSAAVAPVGLFGFCVFGICIGSDRRRRRGSPMLVRRGRLARVVALALTMMTAARAATVAKKKIGAEAEYDQPDPILAEPVHLLCLLE
jgi:hypothetical protein